MRVYSKDLRIRVLKSYENKEGPMHQIATRFGVSLSFVWKLIKKYRQTGSIEPKPHGGGYPAKVDSSGLETVHRLVEHKPDATLKELCDEFERQRDIRVSQATMMRAVNKLFLSRKKNASLGRAR